MIPIEALKLALTEEAKAIALYRKLSLEHNSIREIFDFLITEEEKHQQLIENKIAEMTR
jgi:rubrerythrin